LVSSLTDNSTFFIDSNIDSNMDQDFPTDLDCDLTATSTL
jgi:hypothetical protein